MPTADRVRITEAYRDYAPSRNIHSSVRKLLDTVPEKFLVGLDCVVLTNMAGQPRRKRLGKVTRRGRRIPQSRVVGYYHQAWNGSPAWIELFIDQILKGGGNYPLWLPLFREVLLGHVLFHELGHHIHVVVRPEHREKEDVADDWGTRLNNNFLRKKYWYLIPIAKILRLFRKTKRS